MSYPNDIYNASTWDKFGGLGQLTQTGMKQHEQYGQFLRQRYDYFLSSYYNRNQVYARSTDYDRTLMSTYSLLSGLFPPKDFQAFDPELDWQPIAVHTTDSPTDPVSTINFIIWNILIEIILKFRFSIPVCVQDLINSPIKFTSQMSLSKYKTSIKYAFRFLKG